MKLTRYRHNPWLVSSWATVCVALLLLGLVAETDASRTVLADMDCVVEPSAVVELGAAVPGLLAITLAERTDQVSAGMVLARLESGVEEVSLAIAQTVADDNTGVNLRKLNAAFGQRTRVRNASLLDSSNISAQSMDQIVTEADIAVLQVSQELETHRLAHLEVQRARALLARRDLRSPIDGTVTRRYKSAGEYVDSEPVFQIAKLDQLHVEVIVPIEYMGSLKQGMPAGVSVSAPGFETLVLDATVQRVDSVADAASATFGVQLLLDNSDGAIPSGTRCEVDFFSS